MPPPKPPTIRTLRELDASGLLEALRGTRVEAGMVEVKLHRMSVHRAAVEAFCREIDEMAGLITGDRTHFHGKAHSAVFSKRPDEL